MRMKRMPEFIVTVNRKITKEFRVESKNRHQAKLMVMDKVCGSSMDCREDYGDSIIEEPLGECIRDYVVSVEQTGSRQSEERETENE